MSKRQVILCITAGAALVDVVLGWLLSNGYAAGAGLCALCYVALQIGGGARRDPAGVSAPRPAAARRPVPAIIRHPARPDDPAGLVRQMLAQHRYALLLRPQIAGNLDEEQFDGALEAIQQAMALVPDGEVVLGRVDDALEDGRLDDEEIAAHRGRVVAVQRFFLDRCPVTNREFFEFVAGGGYQQAALWDESVLPAVLDFVDRTGQPGPRDWAEGCYAPDKEQHPVVGISWHEAAAYARWVGKRLPTDAEWVKAASWPVPMSASSRAQRKYPWGDTMDRRRANLWGSGPGGTVPVEDFPEGVSVGGIHQLIGNVWEWTSGNYRSVDHPQGTVVLDAPMKSIRGGAFDTYFDTQATCQFQSGERLLARKHNIGFRCGVGVCDLALVRPQPAESEGEAFGITLAEEVHV
jgi:iron(II)-dependent oxidoreductase